MATILQIANADKNLSLFTKGLKTSELDNKLTELGPFTILGPVNLALSRLMSLTYEQLLEPANRSELLYQLSGYILVGKKMFSDFRNDQKYVTLNGKQIIVSTNNGETRINGAKILARDKQGSNGVVHLIDNTYSTP
ncbi:MAG TPA: fasciclin domain-containing protein [Chitinophagaceae bacterium]|nr:fasciclin domain-containing protein [Chitinophagaceae bacterium]